MHRVNISASGIVPVLMPVFCAHVRRRPFRMAQIGSWCGCVGAKTASRACEELCIRTVQYGIY